MGLRPKHGYPCQKIAWCLFRSAEKVKLEISEEFGVPLLPFASPSAEGTAEPQEADKTLHPQNVRRAALALLRHGASIPGGRRAELEAVILGWLGILGKEHSGR